MLKEEYEQSCTEKKMAGQDRNFVSSYILLLFLSIISGIKQGSYRVWNS